MDRQFEICTSILGMDTKSIHVLACDPEAMVVVMLLLPLPLLSAVCRTCALGGSRGDAPMRVFMKQWFQ